MIIQFKTLILLLTLGLMQVFQVAQSNPIKVATSSDLQMQLSMQKKQHVASDQLNIDFTINNTSQHPVTLLKWGTPLEGVFSANMLSVKHNGQTIPYIGFLVKRGKPKDSDYVTIPANDSITTSLDLSKGYALHDKGDYAVSFKGKMYQKANQQKISSFKVTKKAKEVNIDKDSIMINLSEPRAIQPKPTMKAADFTASCSANQRYILDQALAASVEIAEESRNILFNTPVDQQINADRYIAWFGQHSTSRYNLVSSHFDSIYDALANQQVTMNCDCPGRFSSGFAVVNIYNPYVITVCDSFWNADLYGHDSQAGTLIHETSHFAVVAGTDDHVYHREGALNIARTDPSTAVDNAENHEYFAENSPYRSMGNGGGGGTGSNTGDSYEADDTPAAATLIVANSPQTHSIVPASDQDWLAFTLNSESSITVETSGSVGEDTVMSLYNSNGVLIAENDDIDLDNNLFSRINMTNLGAGTYYIHVVEFESNDEISSYDISLVTSNSRSSDDSSTRSTIYDSGNSLSDNSGGGGGMTDTDFLYLLSLLFLKKASKTSIRNK